MLDFLFGRKSKYGYKLPCGKIVDPLIIYRNLVKGNINSFLDLRDSKNELDYVKGETNACNLIRQTFGLQDLDSKGRGYSDQDCLDLIDEFFGYIEKKGQKAKNTVTSPLPTESTKEPVIPNNDCGCP